MKRKVKCSNCGKEVDNLCANCWRCKDCCDCKEKSTRTIDGVIAGHKNN